MEILPCGVIMCSGRNCYTYLLTYLLTYLISPWSRVLLEQLTVLQLVKKFPAFYGTRRFITAFTSARQPVPILSQFNSVHIPTSHFLKIQLNIILPSAPGSPQWSLSLMFPHQKPVHASPIRATCPALLNFITRTILGEQYRSLSSSLGSFLHSPVTSSLLGLRGNKKHVLLLTTNEKLHL